MERMFYPGGFQGNGELGATQDLVNAFGDTTGYPITHASTVYDPANPYRRRDPRFYSVIFYNSGKANRLNDKAKPMYTFENWNVGVTAAGKDAAGTRSDNSRTNYHIKKYVYMDVNWSDASVKSNPHSKFLFRWAHFVLAYAEAANHLTGDPNVAPAGARFLNTFPKNPYAAVPTFYATSAALTPKAAIAYMRSRTTYDNVTPAMRTADPYLTEVAGFR